jgi:hypothetical protein
VHATQDTKPIEGSAGEASLSGARTWMAGELAAAWLLIRRPQRPNCSSRKCMALMSFLPEQRRAPRHSVTALLDQPASQQTMTSFVSIPK